MSSPGFFITSFISAPIPLTQTPKPITPQLEDVQFGMHSPRPLSPGWSTSNSLLGRPPSVSAQQTNEETSASPAVCVGDFQEQSFDDAVASIYVSTQQDPLSYIIEEKLDDKDIMLMDGKLKIVVSIKQAVRSIKLLSGAYADFPFPRWLLLAPVSRRVR